jgi:hypothetical protein
MSYAFVIAATLMFAGAPGMFDNPVNDYAAFVFIGGLAVGAVTLCLWIGATYL